MNRIHKLIHSKSVRKKTQTQMALLKAELRSHNLLSGSEICASLRISQPTASRLLKSGRDEVGIIRSGRNLSYGLKRRIRKESWEIPVYLVDRFGSAVHAANLFPIGDRMVHVESCHSAIHSQTYPDIPYWMDDLRPSGYLGRLIPKIHSEFPQNISMWSGDNCLQYWLNFGVDLIGNVLLGEHAYDLSVNNDKPGALVVHGSVLEGDEPERYERIAEDVLSYGVAGSSAGGEQPKFLTVKSPGLKKVIVKFSPSDSGAVSIRRRDLLICEHICHSTLTSTGKSAAISKIFLLKSRAFLEVERFDRIAQRGRIGIMSLRVLGEYFLGSIGSWREIANGLLEQGKISQKIRDEIVWRYYFGEYIANTDMHNGNISFVCFGETLERLAPIYDMLPMLYAPRNEEVVNVEFSPKVAPPNDFEIASAARQVAIEYWAALSEDSRLSTNFRRIAQGNVATLKNLE